MRGAVQVSAHLTANCGVIRYFIAIDTARRARSNCSVSRYQLAHPLCTTRRLSMIVTRTSGGYFASSFSHFSYMYCCARSRKST